MGEMIEGTEYMGECIRERLCFCGKDVRLYPLCKMIRAQNAKLDNNCQIMDFVFIDAGTSLKIGKYSTLTWYSLIEGGANCSIGDRVFIGPGAKLLTSTYALDGYYSIEHLPEGCGKIVYGDIIIEDDAYIGANSTIMPGSIIHEGAVVGANSFVKGELEAWGIYVGSPCRKIGVRKQPSEEASKIKNSVSWDEHL